MDFNDIITVAKKETRCIYGDKGTRRGIYYLCIFIIVGPLLPVILALLISASPFVSHSVEYLGDVGGAYVNQTTIDNNLSAANQEQAKQFMSTILLFLYVVFLTLFPGKIISETINGEANDNNAEPILATPIATGDLLLGKIIAANLAPNIPLYGAILLSSVLVDAIYGFVYGLLFPNLIYVLMLFVFVPLCVLADTVVVGVLRLLFKKGWIQRMITGNLTPTQLVAYVYGGTMFLGLVGWITPAVIVEVSLAFLAIIAIGYPMLSMAYGRDNMILKTKEK